MLREIHHHDGTKHQVHLGGWKRQSRDARDDQFAIKLPGGILTATPPSFDNRPICSPIVDQGNLGSCTANAFAGLVEANENRRTSMSSVHVRSAVVSPTMLPTVEVGPPTVSSDGSYFTFVTKVTPNVAPSPTPSPTPSPSPTPAPTPTPAPSKLIRASRLFEYYATRKIEGTTSEDSGASIRDAIKAGNKYGVIDESLYPYDISKFAQNPGSSIWTTAATHKVTSYHAIADGDLATMKSILATGYLIEFGFDVYDYMMSQQMATKGFLPLPGPSESLQGGHAVDLVGYDDNMVNPFNKASKGAFIVRNSWGTNWGVNGYFYMSYDYVANTNLASDFWVVQSAPI
jgi:C1A family cysteine protease